DKYLRAQSDVLDGALGRVPAPGAYERAPGIWCQGEVDVDPDARLTAPVVLGDGVEVGAGAEVGSSVLGPGVRVRERAQVIRAVAHAGAVVGPGARLVDSVLGAHAEVGATAVLTDQTIAGSGVRVVPGARVAGGRIGDRLTGADGRQGS